MATDPTALAVLFSGGADSGLAAVRALDSHEHVCLLTMRHGLELLVGRSRRLAGRLQQRYGVDRVEHRILDNRRLFREALGGGLLRGVHLHYPGVLVLAERAALHGAAAAWSRARGIRQVVDGSTARQSRMAPPQRAESVAAFNEFYDRQGIQYQCPVYQEASSSQRLSELGLLLPQDHYRADGATSGSNLPVELFKLVFGKVQNGLHPIFLVETGLQCLGQLTERIPPPSSRQVARRACEDRYLAEALERVDAALRAGVSPEELA